MKPKRPSRKRRRLTWRSSVSCWLARFLTRLSCGWSPQRDFLRGCLFTRCVCYKKGNNNKQQRCVLFFLLWMGICVFFFFFFFFGLFRSGQHNNFDVRASSCCWRATSLNLCLQFLNLHNKQKTTRRVYRFHPSEASSVHCVNKLQTTFRW